MFYLNSSFLNLFVGLVIIILPFFYITNSDGYDRDLMFVTILMLYLGVMLKRTLFRIRELKKNQISTV